MACTGRGDAGVAATRSSAPQSAPRRCWALRQSALLSATLGNTREQPSGNSTAKPDDDDTHSAQRAAAGQQNARTEPRIDHIAPAHAAAEIGARVSQRSHAP